MPVRACDRCKKQFDQKCNYDNHINRKYKCEIVKDTVNLQSTQTDLTLPIERKKQNNRNDRLKCSNCKKTFSKNSNLQRHLKNKVCHNEQELSEIDKLKKMFEEQNTRIAVLEKQNRRIAVLEKQNERMEKYIKNLKNKNKTVIENAYIKKNKIPKSIRNIVWDKHMGSEFKKGLCQCCKTERITFTNFQCGHITSEKDGGEIHVDNLIPLCQSCNGSMGTMNLNKYKAMYGLE